MWIRTYNLQRIYQLISVLIIAYLLFKAFSYLLNITPEERSQLLNFSTYVSGYLLLLLLLVLSGWLLHYLLTLNKNRISHPVSLLSTIYSICYLFLLLLLEFYVGSGSERVLENLLIAGLGIGIVFITQQLLYANHLRRKGLILEKEKSLAELNQIRAQLNPHFLFNALNMLYASALKSGVEDLAQSVERLSNILRYQIGSSDQPGIALKDELQFLNQFIQFQKTRFKGQENISIHFDSSVENQDLIIRPMILITFIENAFKHGISNEHPSTIWIQIDEKNNQLMLDIRNSDFPKEGKEHSGVGLAQIKRLLPAYYPNHQLQQSVNDGIFKTILTLDLLEEYEQH